jgi:glycosyltransferase involved in cell wall biosynthesis
MRIAGVALPRLGAALKALRMTALSIIIATRNAGGTLTTALDSIRSQTFRDVEVIVIDGASTDSTVSIVRASQDIVSQWVSEPDTGVASAWNKGLTLARGDWVQFLGADDYLWDRESLATIFRDGIGPKGLDCRLVYGSVMALLTDGNPWKPLGAPWPQASREFPRRMSLPHVGLFAHRSLFSEVGRFDESFKVVPDYDWTFRALAATTPFFVAFPVAAFGGNGLSSNPRNQLTFLSECKRARKQHGAYQLTPAEMGRWVHGLTVRLFFAVVPPGLAIPAQTAYRKLARNALKLRCCLTGRKQGEEGRDSCG